MVQMANTDKQETLPYYCFYEDEWEQEFEGRFWNCQGKHIAIVAVVTKSIDWAAYIGSDAPNSWQEKATLSYVAAKGCKLTEEDARYFFPEIKLGYRY